MICVPFVPDWVTWENVKAFGNSNFFVALVASAAGAFAGAYTAQRIAERSKVRDELVKEIRHTNAAIMLSFNICNSMLALKKQHVKRLKETFDSSKNEALAYLRDKNRPANMAFAFKADLGSLPTPSRQPTDALQRQVFDNLSAGGRPLSLVTALIDVVGLLSGVIEKRNQLIERFRATSAETNPDFPSLYFGLPYGGGNVNLEYATSVDAIYSYTDDAIFFSHLLCQDLNEHGNLVLATLKKRFRGATPKVNKGDFAKSFEAGLMPPAEAYADWTDAFVKA